MSEASGTRRAVILAAGRGIRMREPDESVALTTEQAAAADAGLKSLVPLHGQPFIAYVLHELAEAGIEVVCLVVGPGQDDPVRAAVEALAPSRLRVTFAHQSRQRGTADAVRTAEPVLAEAGEADAPFLVVNADNLYPAPVLRTVAELDGPGLAGFDADALVARSNIPPGRVAAFALLEVTDDGYLAGIVEKPGPSVALAMGDAPVSMTCWRFEPSIYDACRSVTESDRGELELVDAVKIAMDRGVRFRVAPATDGVLDLSRRSDIPRVERRLSGRDPRP